MYEYAFKLTKSRFERMCAIVFPANFCFNRFHFQFVQGFE